MLIDILGILLFLIFLFFSAKIMYRLIILRENFRIARVRARKKDYPESMSIIEEYNKLKNEPDQPDPFDYKYFLYILLLTVPIVVILFMIKK